MVDQPLSVPDEPAICGADKAAIVELMRTHPSFAHLPAPAVAGLIERSALAHFAAGDLLIHQGDVSDAAFLLLGGEVEILVETHYGPVHLARRGCNTLLGELGAFAKLPRTATVRALEPVQALRIERDELLQIGRANPDLLLAIIQQLGEHTGTVNRALGFYTNALAALERPDFDPAILDALLNPAPEMVNFARTFRSMAEQITLRRRQHDEMASAASIQRAMLPPPLPGDSCHGRVTLHATMRPAREIGGDFYDYFAIGEDRLGIVIGDVSGKGVPASLFMAMTRTIIRLVARQDDDLAAGIGRANALLSADNDSAMFVTLIYGVLDIGTGTFTYCNCGHNPPLVVRGDGARERLTLTGLPLGVLAEAEYATRKIVLAPGDRLVLYTDGVTEASTEDGAEFGEARLEAAIDALREGTPLAMVDGIVERVDAFAAGAPQADDITCLALVYAAP
jgi:sigma-B regulation protein RsbU (phosphoserine phosphatase)